MEKQDDLDSIESQIKELKSKRNKIEDSKKESFSFRKFVRAFNVLDPIQWAKSISVMFRTLIVTGIILGIIFGMGYWKGRSNSPVKVRADDFIAYVQNGGGEEHKIEVLRGQLFFDDKIVRAKDVPSLKPYGIMLKPKLFIGTKGFGLGAKIAQFYNLNLDVFYMIPDLIGVGVSYQIHLDKGIRINNLSAGVGIGKHLGGNVNDTSIVLYLGWDF